MTRCLLGNSKRTTIRVPARIGSSVAMKSPPVLMLAMFFLTRDGPLLLFVSSYSTCAEMGARSNRRRSNWAELFIWLLQRLRHTRGRSHHSVSEYLPVGVWPQAIHLPVPGRADR